MQQLLNKKWREKWRKFNSEGYSEEFSWNMLYGCIAFIFLCVLFKSILIKIINPLFVTPIFSQLPQSSVLTDVIFLSLFFYSIRHLNSRTKDYLFISLPSLIIGCSVLVVYLLFRVEYQFSTFLFIQVAYADIVVFALIVLLSTYKVYFKHDYPVTKMSLIGDSPLIDEYIDVYSRASYAKAIANHIAATFTKHSFAISIIGEWGAGKTDFLLRVKSDLEKDDTNIVFEYNPWRVKSDGVIEEFFDVLSENLKPYNKSIVSKIREYSEHILKPGKEIQYRLFNILISELIDDKSVKTQYDSINDAIKLTGKKVIVFIDDIDRLTGKEIMEVLRLIRNTANFSNAFFIAGLDQKYIVDVLKNTKDFANEEEYLRKVFQLNITLPAFQKHTLVQKAREILLVGDLDSIDNKRISYAIKKLSHDLDDNVNSIFPGSEKAGLFEKLIDNIRDLKRFSNSFKITYDILKDETDIQDVFVIELIRNRNINLYNIIRNQKLLSYEIDRPNLYIVHKDMWQTFETNNKDLVSSSDLAILKTAVEYLLDNDGSKNERRFQFIPNFHLYFSYQLFNLISYKEFNFILKQDAPAIAKQFNEWIKSNKAGELHNIISEVDRYADEMILMKMMKVFLSLSNVNHFWSNRAYIFLIPKRFENFDIYFGKDALKERAFYYELMNDKFIDPFTRAQLAFQFLNIYFNKHPQQRLVFSKKVWQKIIYYLFDEYLSSLQEYSIVVLNFLTLNYGDLTALANIIIYGPACRRLRCFLRDKKMFEGYLTFLIREHDTRDGLKLTFEPFLEQIFGSWNNFKDELNVTQFEDNDLQKLQSIILSYGDSYYQNNKKQLENLNNSDKDFIEDWVRKHRG